MKSDQAFSGLESAITYALRACFRALPAGSKSASTSCLQVAAAGGDRWLLMAVRGYASMAISSLGVRLSTARTVCRGWPASGPGRLPPDPWLLTGVPALGSGVKRDFACTLTRHFPSVLVVLRSQSRLSLEGRTCTLSAPSPDLGSSGLLWFVRKFAQFLMAEPLDHVQPRWDKVKAFFNCPDAGDERHASKSRRSDSHCRLDPASGPFEISAANIILNADE